MADYGFEYFCGANVTIRIRDIPILEASGISVSIQESKFPLYGYSSRFYDAIARGRVLVNGTLAINLVHHDYLPALIQYAYGLLNGNSVETSNVEMNTSIFEALTASEDIIEEDDIDAIADKLQQALWGKLDSSQDRFTKRGTAIDNYNGIDIEIIFGDQDFAGKRNGVTGILIQDLHFTGKAFTVEASEGVIYELYTFIARNILTLKNTQLIETTNPEGQVTIDEQNIVISDPFDFRRVDESFTNGVI